MRKLFFFPLAALISFVSCDSTTVSVKGMEAGKDSSRAATATVEAKAERNKQAVLTTIDGMNKHSVEAMFSQVAPGFKDFGDGSMPPMLMDSIKAGMGEWFAAFPDYKIENMKVVVDGEWVMVWCDQSGTWKGRLWGQKPTGKSFKQKEVEIFRMNDEGKITEHHNVQNFSYVAKQIGYKMD